MNWEKEMASPAAAVAEEDKGLAKDHRFNRTRRDLKAIEKAKVIVVTGAQNNTEPEAHGFLRALERYCEERKGQLVIRPIRYKNPTSRRDPQEDEKGDYWWHEAFHPYLVDDPLVLAPTLVMPDVRIQATASNPLVSLDSRSKGASAIYGATQLQMRTVPTPQADLPKILYSTGAVTQKNYSTTKAGNLASFHHSYSAIVVEKEKGRFHMREIVWDGESFIDCDRQYYADRSSEQAPPPEALVMGDEHAWFHDPDFRHATFDAPDSMVNVLQPKRLIRHDVFDCFSVSPHHNNQKLTQVIKGRENWGNLRRELDDTIRYIDATTPEYDHFIENVIVSSNHHDHLTRWLENGERYVTPENAELYHWFMHQIYANAKMGPCGPEFPHPVPLYFGDKMITNCRFLSNDESYVVCNIELGMHGHLGPNGARGNPIGMAKIGIRFVSGHIHSSCIWKGGYWVGTGSRFKLPYTSGPSSWMHSNTAVNANGKRQMHHVIERNWRAHH